MREPIKLTCPCGRETLVTGTGADLLRLVEEKNALVREVAMLREAMTPRPRPGMVDLPCDLEG